ncbi:MAG: hypothetical protein FWC75_04700 [Oscillospiraceae bacterium]|nr:hypothetical protein [Oscillospiraceae bacterium]
MKKSIKIRVICLILAVTVLGGAVAAAAVMGSPYETLRTAMLDALTMRNVTVEMHMDIKFNGATVHEIRVEHIQGDSRALGTETTLTGTMSYSGFNFSTPNMEMTPFRQHGQVQEDTQWYRAQVFATNINHNSSFSSSPFGMFTYEDRNSSEMRFAELLLDLIVGDLRNNISMTSENGVRRIRGSLSEHQVPEIVRVGLDMILEGSHHSAFNHREFLNDSGTEVITETTIMGQGETTVSTHATPVRLVTDAEVNDIMHDNVVIETTTRGGHGRAVSISADDHNAMMWGVFYIDGMTFAATGPSWMVSEDSRPVTRSDFEAIDPFEIPMRNLVINHITGEADVDMDGNLTNFNVNGLFAATNIFGEVNEIEINISIRFSDIGTSNPYSPIPGAEDILTMRNLQSRFGDVGSTMTVFFTLNEDGTVNEDSITTMHPLEQARVIQRELESAEIETPEADTEYPDENSDEDTEDVADDITEPDEPETDDDNIDDEE